MAVGDHRVLQCELKLLQGSDPWLLVKYPGGSFRMPLHASAEELWRGVLERWSAAAMPRHLKHSEAMVRIGLAELRRLQLLDAADVASRKS